MTTVEGPPPAPRGVAVSGVVFAVLYVVGLTFVRLAVPADPAESGAWLADPASRTRVGLALNVIPFAGIAFLWFMGSLRNRIGDREDRFLSTVLLGSGLLFVAMLFVAAAVARGLLESFDAERSPERSETYAVARAAAYALMNGFAVKMAAVFVVATSSIGLRREVFPRWMAFVGYAAALVMLLVITDFAWIALLFPAWVLLLSVHILTDEFGRMQPNTTTEP